MRLIKFELEEQQMIFESFAFICSNREALKIYQDILMDIDIFYPVDDLDCISGVIESYTLSEPITENYQAIKELTELNVYSRIVEYIGNESIKVSFKHFIDRIKGNVDFVDYKRLVTIEDNKEAFFSYIGGNLKALINSTDEYKFAYWNGRAWSLKTEEETKIFYGDFILTCKKELEKYQNCVDKEEFFKMKKKINSWDTRNRVNECFEAIKRDGRRILNIKDLDTDEKIICTKDGTIIDFLSKETRKATRDDLILHTKPYYLINKEEATRVATEIFDVYKDVLGVERLNFILDLISFKLMGKNLQKAIWLIGAAATGKSTFKNILNDLFGDDVTKIPYTYYTSKHKGNDDVSRDDILVSLNGKKIGLSSEGECGDIINQAKFKNILSNSIEKARQTRGKLIDVDLQRLDLIIDTNEQPSFTGYDEAINRRMLFVNFDNPIPVEKRNASFYRDKVKPKMNHIFSYFVYRALEMSDMLDIPKVIKDDTEVNIKELDSLYSFIDEKLIVIDDKDIYITVDEVYKAYIKYIEEENFTNVIPEEKLNNDRWAKNYIVERIIQIKGFDKVAKKQKGKKRERSLTGLTFKGDDPIEFEANQLHLVEAN